jgi:ribosome-interacting GTPase 1
MTPLLCSLIQVDQLARLPDSVVGSVRQHFNIGEPHEDDLLKAKLWEYLGLTRVYTKRKGNRSCL